MINFFKRLVIRFLVRKSFVVENRSSLEMFIVSHVTSDGYISLLTDQGSHLPVSFSVFKKFFDEVERINNFPIEGTFDNMILLASGEVIPLQDMNEQSLEDSLDLDYL